MVQAADVSFWREATSAAGGLLFDVLADRLGRTRALSLSILIYAGFTAACGLAQNVTQLAVFRIFLGVGMEASGPAVQRSCRNVAGAAPRQGPGIDRSQRSSFADIFRGPILGLTIALTLMTGATMFAWWGWNFWIRRTCRCRWRTAASGSQRSRCRASSWRCRSGCRSRWARSRPVAASRRHSA